MLSIECSESKYSPRSEVSLLNPSGEPKTFKFGSVPHSVFFILPIEIDELQYPFLKELRKAFPKGQGLGLILKKDDAHFIYELALGTEAECCAALDIYVNFKYKEQNYSLKAIQAASNYFDYFHVALSGITLKDFTSLKTQILETFYMYGKILDIVLYEDDPTGSWFTGNGYIIIRCEKYNGRYKPIKQNYLTLYPHQPNVRLVWTQLNDCKLSDFNIKNKLCY